MKKGQREIVVELNRASGSISNALHDTVVNDITDAIVWADGAMSQLKLAYTGLKALRKSQDEGG